jgi:DNA-binding MarR family transcriptional regulator
MNRQSEIALVALRRILKATEANVKTLAARSGLTASQLLALQSLATRGEMLVGDLARMLDLRHATISILLDKLQDLGLVERRKHEHDRRKVWVRITPAGIERLRGAPGLLQNRFRQRFSALPEWEQSMLLAGLQRIVDLLDAGDIDASPVLDIGGIAELPEKGPED